MSEKKSALEEAYRYLSSRMRTAAEVRKHLADKGCDADEINDAVSELKEMRYIDDCQYALRYFEYNHEKRRGVLRAERELAGRGVDRSTVENAREDFLFENKIDEYAEALEIGRRELYTDPDIPGGEPAAKEWSEKLAAKTARRLEARGFARSDIFRVLEALRREADPGD